MKIHRSYLPVLSDILDRPWLKALSHITGGGIVENTERVINSNQTINIDWDAWEIPEIFKLIMIKGDVPFDDMARTFNLGIGMILIVDKNNISDIDKYLKSIQEPYTIIGKVINK